MRSLRAGCKDQKSGSLRMKNNDIIVYLDGVDWQYEIGSCSDGNTVYPSIRSLKEKTPCYKGCGIVECSISFRKWILKQDFTEMFKNAESYTPEFLEKNSDIIHLESSKKHLEFLEKLVLQQKNKIKNLKLNLRNKK